MRTCPEYEARISALIDGCLPEADRAELTAHLAACPACQAYFDDQIAIHDALVSLEDVPAPADLSQRVMARVRETAQERAPARRTIALPRWRRWAALAACCAVAAAGLWGLYRGGSGDPTASRAAPRMAAYDAGAAAPEEGDCQALADAPQAEAAGVSPAGDDASQEARREERSAEDPAAPAGSEDKAAMDRAALPAEAALPAPAMAAAMAADGAGTLRTASPAAGAWVEEKLGLPWTGGGEYRLTAAEYADLRETLLAAEAEFDETPGQGEIYLLLADF